MHHDPPAFIPDELTDAVGYFAHRQEHRASDRRYLSLLWLAAIDEQKIFACAAQANNVGNGNLKRLDISSHAFNVRKPPELATPLVAASLRDACADFEEIDLP